MGLFLEVKSEALEAFKIFKTYVEKESGYQIKSLRTDKGTKFTSYRLKAFCEAHGI